MAHVVRSECLSTLDRSCVEVCPVDCFYYINDEALNTKYKKGKSKNGEFGMMMINPDECINCNACESECPVGAILEDVSVPEADQEWIEINSKVTTALSDEEMDASRCTSKG